MLIRFVFEGDSPSSVVFDGRDRFTWVTKWKSNGNSESTELILKSEQRSQKSTR